MFKLIYNARVLEVVRGLLGDDAVIHNVGMSISGALYTGPLNTHQDQPLPTGNKAWGGRTPPPTHPLSVQVLWLMEDVNYVNGATYMLPMTQHRAERLDKWKMNATEDEGVDMGLFPVSYFDGQAGDAFITLGSIWHGGSTNLSREPRLVLLVEVSVGCHCCWCCWQGTYGWLDICVVLPFLRRAVAFISRRADQRKGSSRASPPVQTISRCKDEESEIVSLIDDHPYANLAN